MRGREGGRVIGVREKGNENIYKGWVINLIFVEQCVYN
jgi:hypothetical protein